MARRPLPEATRIEALTLLMEYEGNVNRVAKETGLARRTIQKWRAAVLESSTLPQSTEENGTINSALAAIAENPVETLMGQSIEERAPMTRAAVLAAIEDIATTDTREIVGWDEHGNTRITPSDALTKAQARVVAAIKVKRRREVKGSGEDAEVWETEEIEFRYRDQLGALNSIARMPHIGLLPSPGLNLTVHTGEEKHVHLSREFTIEELRAIQQGIQPGDSDG